MKYTREQRLDIAQKVYGKEMTIAEAAVRYDLNLSTVKGYLRMYRAENNLPPRNSGSSKSIVFRPMSKVTSDTEDLESMTKEELIREVIMARINEARAKKGYAVKGDGTQKEYVLLDNKNQRLD